MFKLFIALSFFMLFGCGNDRNEKNQLPNGKDVKKEGIIQERRIAIDIGIVVSSLEQSLAFYNDLLGLPILGQIETKLIGEGRMVQLRHGTSLIKIVEFKEAPVVTSPKGISSAKGLRYITFMVHNLDDIVSKMKKKEIPVLLPVTELSNGSKIYMVEDPDGNVVEFVQESVH